MHNHDQKARDMARSILPSSSRRGARKAKRAVHHSERVRERQMLHCLLRAEHPDDVTLDLTGIDRGEIRSVVVERRFSDKVAPLLRWAEVVVERDAALASASPSDRRCYFRGVLGVGLMADHALFHLEFSVLRLDTDLTSRWSSPRRRLDETPLEVVVRDLVEAGLHGVLNRAVKAERNRMARPATRRERRDLKASGINPWEVRVEGRLLAGAHDVAAFAAAAERDLTTARVIRDLHHDLL